MSDPADRFILNLLAQIRCHVPRRLRAVRLEQLLNLDHVIAKLQTCC
ncbi:hypothetical protein [Pseudolysobacter antarcticus]|nr:hypothetical protein [Pseudolysobacter antarcticus]